MIQQRDKHIHCTARRVMVAVRNGATFSEIVAATRRKRGAVYMALRQ